MAAYVHPRAQKSLKMLFFFHFHAKSQSSQNVIVCVHELITFPWRQMLMNAQMPRITVMPKQIVPTLMAGSTAPVLKDIQEMVLHVLV